MSLPRYKNYRNSCVAWLGDVPEHWNVKQGRRIYSQRREQALAADEQLSATQKYGVVPQKKFMELEDQKVTLALNGLGSFKHVESDDFVISLRSFQGGIERSKYSGCVSPAYTVLRAVNHVDANFMGYTFKSPGYVAALQSVTEGIRDGKNISFEQFGQINVPFPPNTEQRAIAVFLDRETEKIDALIAEQQRLIELLKEKRQAVISHAVTKGLNPVAPMKDSGIEWLGEVPEHWEVKRIKRISSICYGIGEPPQYHPEGTPLIRATNIHNGRVLEEGMVFVNPADIPEKRIVWLSAGDIIVVRSGAYTGDSAIIPKDYGWCIAGFDMVLRCDGVVPYFVQLALLSKYLKEGQIDLEKMRAAQPHLNAEELGNSVIVLPSSIEEQTEIISFLDREITKIDALTAEAKTATTLLQERRTALISAAVTGKIDVRGLVASQSEREVTA